MRIGFGLLAFVALIACSSAQYQQQNRGGSSSCGNCACPQQYVPFCATDGRRETTFSSKCQLECAQKCNPGLRVKFEGVCAKPYRDSKNLGGREEYWGAASSYQPTTRRPNTQRTTTRRAQYNPSYPVQTTRRPSYGPTTTRRAPSGYPGYPTSPNYPSQTTRRYSNDLYGSGSVAVPYTIPTTTNKPWWQSQNQQSGFPSQSSGGYGSQSQGWRGSRGAADEDDGDDYY